VVLVPLPGHTPGSLGIFINSFRGRRVFFIGDAAWGMEGIELPSHKLKLLSDRTDNDTQVLSETLWRLHWLHLKHPDLLIVPAHDLQAFEAVRPAAVR
jgi:glyoxylase-like metal-dependent hydrolase (beta-lactamase superfamily II)